MNEQKRVLNKRQIERAARLFSLAVVAHLDSGDDEVASAVVDHARERAQARLLAMGHEPGDVTTINECIAAALRPTGQRAVAT